VDDGTSPTQLTITSITTASPSVFTTSGAHGYTTGDEVEISGLKIKALNSSWFAEQRPPSQKIKITVLSATTFSGKYVQTNTNWTMTKWGYYYVPSSARVKRYRLVAGTDSWITAWVVTTVAEDTFEESVASQITGCSEVPSSGTPRVVSWTEADNAQGYNVYKRKDGIFGFIGYTEAPRFTDNGITADTTITPPVENNPFKYTDSYPSAVSYYQQRRVFANSNNEPEKIWATKSGNFANLTQSAPIRDDDAVIWQMVGAQVNEVRHMIEMGKLVVLTSGGEWTIEGDSAGILRPTDINPKQHGYNGANDLKPIIVGGSVLYVQARGSIVRDLGYDFNSDGYRGNDLTIFSAHLFDNYTLIDWCYQQIPHSVVWAVRDDGTLLGLTYVKEHQIVGWHHHDFDGVVESVCSVPEGTEDALYLLINRTINGATVRYVERMASRRTNELLDLKYMDAFLTYDGRNTGATTMTLSGSGWTYTDTLTLTASASTFKSTDVGNAVHLTGADGEVIRATITAYTSATVVSILPNRTVPASLQATATATWSMAVDTVTGLWHLEGETVSVFADGFVVANPNNDAYVTRTVANGQVTLDRPYAVIHVGLPVTADIETLNIDTASGETLADKKMVASKLTLFVESSRGIWAGSNPPTDDATDPLEGLTEYKARDTETYEEPVDLETGTIEILIQPEWKSNGRIFVRQVDPLPAAILAIAPAGLYPTG
jgi:hypothetical protein